MQGLSKTGSDLSEALVLEILSKLDTFQAALWNPSTREFKILPQRPPLVDSTSFDCLGFGYDSQTDDYKVVNYFEEDADAGSMFEQNNQVELEATGSSGHLINEKFSTLPLPQTLDGFYSHLLDFNGLLGAPSIESVPGVEMLLGFWKNGEFFIELVLFDPSTRELKNLGIHASKWTMQITAYVESLVPINGRSEHEGRDASN
ncbi:hypothetical protein V6N11_031528 [Hibiscus sabdariffa]|uniref:F-box protein n=1 Tax=Hibiscus sabdariffa TaxID=183260 RepID=A0ABR2SYN8_9ROSI